MEQPLHPAETLTGETPVQCIMNRYVGNWSLTWDGKSGKLTVNGEKAGTITESLPGKLYFAYKEPANGSTAPHNNNGWASPTKAAHAVARRFVWQPS